jgi:hypothetical protein
MNVKSSNNTNKWQMEFISAFKGLTYSLEMQNDYLYLGEIYFRR